MVHVSSGNQTTVACVLVVRLHKPWSFLQGNFVPGHFIVSSFKFRVSCVYSNWIFQSRNIFSCYPLFFVSALQLEGVFIPMCGIQFLHWIS